MISFRMPNGLEVCGDCAEGKEKKTEPVGLKNKQRVEVDKTGNPENKDVKLNPLTKLGNMIFVVDGVVYDGCPRDEVCEHEDQLITNALRKKDSYFCEDCGQVMKEKKKKRTRKEPKSEPIKQRVSNKTKM